jgi:Ca2+/Na+ antiporter
MLMFQLPVMLLMSVVMFLMVRFKNSIDRRSGFLLVGLYAAYIGMVFVNPTLMM